MTERSKHTESPETMKPTFVLLLGPSGVGKSSLIRNLSETDKRFKFVSPITDRPLRPGETEKISITKDAFTALEDNNFFLLVNKLYDNRYGTPKSSIEDILRDGNIPILDFPLSSVDKLDYYRNILYKIYIVPPTLGTLRNRLGKDLRAEGNTRYEESREELLDLVKTHFKHPYIDKVLINRNLDLAGQELRELIYNHASIG